MDARGSRMFDGRRSLLFSGRQSLMPTIGGRIKQRREAKEMEKAVHDRAHRLGVAPPRYEFLEIIGKGSFGRVFKSRSLATQATVAVKVIDVDNSDYNMDPAHKDEALKDFVNEISILKTLKASQAKNVNNIHDAFSFYSQLWIVSDYCPGGSIHTLMKATKNPGLEENYIIVIARELALALKHVHEVGIIHRDVKAANVLITQEGQLQLCDFGVSGVLESGVSKRHTVIGTPFWMPPEMFEEDGAEFGYGTEIDCWAFGCTVIELATGLPPNAKIAPHMLHKFLSKAPRLEGEQYSAVLRDFVAFCLPEDRKNRPTAEEIMKHSFVADTSSKYPTSVLRELIERFAVWEQSGGERASLFNPNVGAAGPEALEELADDGDDWNFSTTDDFDEEVYNQLANVVEREHDEMTNFPRQPPASTRGTAPYEHQIGLTQRAQRGEQKMGRIFDPSGEDYEYSAANEESDLPLRNPHEDGNKVRESVIDLDLAMGVPEPQIYGVPTIRANRQSTTPFYGPDEGEDGDDDEDYPAYDADENTDSSSKRDTMAWSFPTINAPSASVAENRKTMEWSFASASLLNDDNGANTADETLLSAPTGAKLGPGFRPALKHTATAPPGEIALANPRAVPDQLDLDDAIPDHKAPIDLDLAAHDTVDIDDEYYSRPSTGYSTAADSSFTTDADDGSDPFAFDLNAQTIRRSNFPAAAAPAPGTGVAQPQGRPVSYHTHSQSEPNRSSNPEFDESYNYAHTRGSSYNIDMDSSLSRAPSVKASMDSLRHATDDDDDDSPEVATRRPGAYAQSQSQASYDLYDTDTSSTSGPPPSIPLPKRPYDSNTVKRSNFAALRNNAGSDSERPRGRLHPHDVQPAASRASNARRGGSSTDQRAQRPLPFPEPVGPSAASLEEDADPRVVAEEMRRLLRDYTSGLGLAGSLLGSMGHRGNRNV